MASGLRRRRILHRTGLATLLVGAAMAMSGCWALVVGPDQNGRKALVMKASVTQQIIYRHCPAPTSIQGAQCVLNSVAKLCATFRPQNLTALDCAVLTAWPYSSELAADMRGAIREVLFQGDACLVGYFGPSGTNWTASRLGFACGW